METLNHRVVLGNGWAVVSLDVGDSPLSLVEIEHGKQAARVYTRIDLDKGVVLDREHIGKDAIDEEMLLKKVLPIARAQRLTYHEQARRPRTEPPLAVPAEEPKRRRTSLGAGGRVAKR